jgi:hypothetical protein
MQHAGDRQQNARGGHEPARHARSVDVRPRRRRRRAYPVEGDAEGFDRLADVRDIDYNMYGNTDCRVEYESLDDVRATSNGDPP